MLSHRRLIVMTVSISLIFACVNIITVGSSHACIYLNALHCRQISSSPGNDWLTDFFFITDCRDAYVIHSYGSGTLEWDKKSAPAGLVVLHDDDDDDWLTKSHVVKGMKEPLYCIRYSSRCDVQASAVKCDVWIQIGSWWMMMVQRQGGEKKSCVWCPCREGLKW